MTKRRLFALGVLFVAPLAAKEWLVRTYELPVGGMTRAAQDSAGFLWIGSPQGLYRFDGSRFLRWAPDVFGRVNMIVAGAAGEVFVLPERGRPLYRITPTGASRELEGVEGIAPDSEGRIWVAREEGLYVLERGFSQWRKESDKFWEGRYLSLFPAQNASIFVTTVAGIWRARSDRPAARILTSKHAVSVLETARGMLYVAEEDGTGCALFRLRGDVKEKILYWRGRTGSMLERGKSVWIFNDRVTAVVRPDLRLEILRPEERIRLGEGLLVDREGSLWTSRPAGLSVIPEPDTEMWTEADGLPGPGARHMIERPEGIWVSNWASLFRMKEEGGSWRVQVQPVVHQGVLCADGAGTLWTQRPWRNGHFESLQVADWVCASATQGRVWLGTTRLYLTPSSFGAPVAVRVPESMQEIGGILEDHQGTLWVVSGEQICSRPASAVLADSSPDWACRVLPGTIEISSPVELASGAILLMSRSGPWRYDGQRWSPMPGFNELSQGPVVSRRGGVWMLGVGERWRVVENRDSPNGWQIAERISGWQGVPRTVTESALESSDGSLWLTTQLGLIRVPPQASAPVPTPPIVLTGLSINGKPRQAAGVVQIPPGENYLEAEFAALSYRDRSLLRYQYRLRANAPWSDANEREPHFHFVDLRAGDYRLEVRASLDGLNWSTAPAALDLRVPGPWYFRWWAFLVLAASLTAALYGAYRARLAVVLRLERQRSRIAMDLHDGIGSGLGSIGILSGLAASDQVNEEQRRDFASRIAETAGELGLALSDIVWSLRPDTDTVEALATQLARRGRILFPNTQPQFTVDFPGSWQPARLPVLERRNLLLIGQEALHNAARHSQATVVKLGFRQDSGWWVMEVADDGCGLGNGGVAGMGLANMKHRTEVIGAQLEFEQTIGGGTSVSVRFKAGASRGAGAVLRA